MKFVCSSGVLQDEGTHVSITVAVDIDTLEDQESMVLEYAASCIREYLNQEERGFSENARVS